MKIKNYSSEASPSVSMAKIEEALVQIGASNINKQYKDKICTGISFLIYDERQKKTIAFALKAQVNEAFNILWGQIKKPIDGTKERIMDQANRTAWKIVSDWTEIQCSMILLGQAEPLQMFLPFVYDPASDTTLYDRIVSGNVHLQLTA